MEPDIEWNESEGMPYGGVYRGRDAIVENVFGPILADVEEFTADPDEILRLDDARVMARGRHGGNGARGPGDARVVHIWTVTDGKGSRDEQLADTRPVCDAAGRGGRRPPAASATPQIARVLLSIRPGHCGGHAAHKRRPPPSPLKRTSPSSGVGRSLGTSHSRLGGRRRHACYARRMRASGGR